MYYPGIGVFCKGCGQAIVLLDAEPDELRRASSNSVTLELQCASCRCRKSYRFDQLLHFESAEPSSGDWRRVSRPRAQFD